jgi:hypothetical protein
MMRPIRPTRLPQLDGAAHVQLAHLRRDFSDDSTNPGDATSSALFVPRRKTRPQSSAFFAPHALDATYHAHPALAPHANVAYPNAFPPNLAARQCVPAGKSRSAFVRDRPYATAAAATVAEAVNARSAVAKMDSCVLECVARRVSERMSLNPSIGSRSGGGARALGSRSSVPSGRLRM